VSFQGAEARQTLTCKLRLSNIWRSVSGSRSASPSPGLLAIICCTIGFCPIAACASPRAPCERSVGWGRAPTRPHSMPPLAHLHHLWVGHHTLHHALHVRILHHLRHLIHVLRASAPRTDADFRQ
jgi:hypothetical protein